MGYTSIISVSFLFFILASAGLQAQIEWLDYIDPEDLIHPDILIQDWMNDQETPAASEDSKAVVFRSGFRIQSLLSSNFSRDSTYRRSRWRFLMHSYQARFSFLAQRDYQTAGLSASVIPDKVALFFGDFQFDHGLGLAFSSRYNFDSWTQNPHQLLYRAGGLKVNTSSDPARALRGGGVSLNHAGFGVNLFFSGSCEGIGVNYRTDHTHIGALYSSFTDAPVPWKRYGFYVQQNLGGAILFSEFAIQSDQAGAMESGLSFFRHERHQFILLHRYYSRGFDPRMSKLSFSKPATRDQSMLLLNYKWEWKNNWFFQMEMQSSSSYWLDKGKIHPYEHRGVKCGLIWQTYGGSHFILRVTGRDQGVKGTVRYRVSGDDGSYIQCELGGSVSHKNPLRNVTNFFSAFDWKWPIQPDRLVMITGLCLHRGEPGAVLLYRYEPDLFYQMSLPVLSGSGIRGYLKLSWAIHPALKMECKINKSLRFDRSDSVSDQLRVKVQLIYRPDFILQSSV